MIVIVRCPTCDSPTEVDDGLAETRLTCRRCRRAPRVEFDQRLSGEVRRMRGALLTQAIEKHLPLCGRERT